MTPTRFRLAAVLSMAMGFAGAIVVIVGESRLPVPLQDYLRAERETEVATVEWVTVAGFPLIVAGLASFVGLLRFSAWARPVSTGSSIASIALVAFLRPTVEPGLATALSLLASMAWGAVLAVSYLAPTVARRFAVDTTPD